MHASLVPVVNLAPVAGYDLHQFVPVEGLRLRIKPPTATMTLERRLFFKGSVQDSARGTVKFDAQSR